MKASLVVLVLGMMLIVGCASHVHTVGDGPQGNDMLAARQWYILWGLVPLNAVDTHAMAAGTADYEIRTEQSALDIILNIFTSAVTVYSRTVSVTK